MTDINKKDTQVHHDLTEHHKHVAVIDILGQRAHVPINLSLVIVIVVLVVGLVSIEYISQGVTSTIKYATSGGYNELNKNNTSNNENTSARIYQFWTPGADTWKDITSSCADKKCLDELQDYKPSNFTTDKKLRDFGEILKQKLNIPGYSRFPVIGSGGSQEKSGWYWKIIIPNNDELDKKKFIAQYKNYFNRDNVRIEESHLGDTH